MPGLSFKPIIPLLLASFMAATPLLANESHAGELTAEFNHGAVSDTYALSCDARDKTRESNIRTLVQDSTPDYFQKEALTLALYSPHLTPLERQAVGKLVESLPDYVMDLFYTQGGVFVFTARSLVEALPEFADYQAEDGSFPYWNAYVALYRGNEKRVFLTFYTAVTDDNGEVSRYERMNYNKSRLLYHELGHFLDDILGDLGNLFDEAGSERFTDRNSYQDRLKEDFNALADPGASFAKAELKYISYYLPKEYKGRVLYGKRDEYLDAKREIFAELWTEMQGKSSYNLSKYFPRTFKLVQQLDRELQQLHSTNNQNCSIPAVTLLPTRINAQA